MIGGGTVAFWASLDASLSLEGSFSAAHRKSSLQPSPEFFPFRSVSTWPMDLFSLKCCGDDRFGIIIQITLALNPDGTSNCVESFGFASHILFLWCFLFEKTPANAKRHSRWQFKVNSQCQMEWLSLLKWLSSVRFSEKCISSPISHSRWRSQPYLF
jgi:hypothetical protein